MCLEVNQDKKCLVNIANLNSQNQIVLSGNKQGIEKAIDECKLLGAKRAIPLPMSVPAHSMLMKEAADKFVEHYRRYRIHYTKNSDNS